MGDLDFEELDRMIDDITSSGDNQDSTKSSSAKASTTKSAREDSVRVSNTDEAKNSAHRRSMDIVPTQSKGKESSAQPSMVELHAQVMARREKRAEEIRRRMAEERRARAAAHSGSKEQRRKAEMTVDHRPIHDSKELDKAKLEESARKAREAAELAEQLEADREERQKLERRSQKTVARRAVHYPHVNSRRALTQPRPVEETALDLSVSESANDEPYVSPFIDGVKVEKKPIGQNRMQSFEKTATSASTPVSTLASSQYAPHDELRNSVASNNSDYSDSRARNNDFIEDFIGEMRERREAKAKIVERPTVAPDMSAKLDNVDNSRIEESVDIRADVDREARENESRYAMANIPTYDEYAVEKGHCGWGWVVFFVVLLIVVSVAGVYLYFNNFFV